MSRFCRLELRTTDVVAALAFYARVIGDGHPLAGAIVRLPSEAAARGAPAHWLGHIGVDDVESAARAFVDRGGTRLGPTRRRADGADVALLRDPGGAVLALATSDACPGGDGVVWHLLHTHDVPRAQASYAALFGWCFDAPIDLGARGTLHPFAWTADGANVGSFTEIGARLGVHPHWLFHFRVAALDAALDEVRAAGGLALPTIVLPSGDRIAVCEDPQGAAFALREAESSRTEAAGGKI